MKRLIIIKTTTTKRNTTWNNSILISAIRKRFFSLAVPFSFVSISSIEGGINYYNKNKCWINYLFPWIFTQWLPDPNDVYFKLCINLHVLYVRPFTLPPPLHQFNVSIMLFLINIQGYLISTRSFTLSHSLSLFFSLSKYRILLHSTVHFHSN